jgi:hypothetical protein
MNGTMVAVNTLIGVVMLNDMVVEIHAVGLVKLNGMWPYYGWKSRCFQHQNFNFQEYFPL